MHAVEKSIKFTCMFLAYIICVSYTRLHRNSHIRIERTCSNMYNLYQRRQSGLKSWGLWNRVKANSNFQANFRKISIFSGNLKQLSIYQAKIAHLQLLLGKLFYFLF